MKKSGSGNSEKTEEIDFIFKWEKMKNEVTGFIAFCFTFENRINNTVANFIF